MVTHYIIMSSSYSQGCRIALHYVIDENTDIEKLKPVISTITSKCGKDVSLSVHSIQTEEKTWDEATVNSIEIDTRDNRVLINSDYEVGTWSKDNYVFYSKEEAERICEEISKPIYKTIVDLTRYGNFNNQRILQHLTVFKDVLTSFL